MLVNSSIFVSREPALIIIIPLYVLLERGSFLTDLIRSDMPEAGLALATEGIDLNKECLESTVDLIDDLLYR